MEWRNWEDLHQQLIGCHWFSEVGKPAIAQGTSPKYVTSWDNACIWASAEISWWCGNESSNVLSIYLSDNHRVEYRKWNDHIKSFAAKRDELVERIIAPAIPVEFRTSRVKDWIRGQITGAYLECIYSPFAEVHLACDQLEWYLQGRFPCGWTVQDEESFPSRAVTIVY